MDRDFFFVPFCKETDDYFVNDSCRESLRPLIVHIFRLTRDFGTVCGCGTGFEIYLEFNSFTQFLPVLNDQTASSVL